MLLGEREGEEKKVSEIRRERREEEWLGREEEWEERGEKRSRFEIEGKRG